MSQQDFRFGIKEQVIIKEVMKKARVELIQVDYVGVQYRVCYWDGGERKTAWVYEDELEEA
jgi:hypothetical protein